MSALKQTKYAADRAGSVCILIDIRGQARPNSIQVWSYGANKIVNLPRKLVHIHNDGAKRWAAASLPRWLRDREGLYGKPEPVMSGFCREFAGPDTRTAEQQSHDAEQKMAQFVVDQKNKYAGRPTRYRGGISAGGNTYESPGR